MQELTASEPLSLEEEYEMQETWRDDPKKCTFIILSFQGNAAPSVASVSAGDDEGVLDTVEVGVDTASSPPTPPVESHSALPSISSTPMMQHITTSADGNLVIRMIGDVNIFLHDRDDPGNAEIEIMIAEKQFTRKGIATEALSIMMIYGAKCLGVHRYFAKISESNVASMSLFSKLGYREVNYVAAFQEYEFELLVTEEMIASLSANFGQFMTPLPFEHEQ